MRLILVGAPDGLSATNPITSIPVPKAPDSDLGISDPVDVDGPMMSQLLHGGLASAPSRVALSRSKQTAPYVCPHRIAARWSCRATIPAIASNLPAEPESRVYRPGTRARKM